MKIEVIIEKSDEDFWGRIEGRGNFLPVTVASTTAEALNNLKDLIKDYLKHERKTDKAWNKVKVTEIEFDLHYDIQALFSEHDYLNATAVAEKAGLNGSLLRQYKSGVKHPTLQQAKRIEKAIRAIGKELSGVSVYA